jgi:hypothetical protein
MRPTTLLIIGHFRARNPSSSRFVLPSSVARLPGRSQKRLAKIEFAGPNLCRSRCPLIGLPRKAASLPEDIQRPEAPSRDRETILNMVLNDLIDTAGGPRERPDHKAGDLQEPGGFEGFMMQ